MLCFKSSIAKSDIIDRRAGGWVVPGLLPPRLRAETMLRFHPIAQKQKTDLNIASVLVRAGGPGPGRPLRQSQAGNLVATSIWPGLGWLGWAGRGSCKPRLLASGRWPGHHPPSSSPGPARPLAPATTRYNVFPMCPRYCRLLAGSPRLCRAEIHFARVKSSNLSCCGDSPNLE